MSQSGFKVSGIAGSGPAVYIEDETTTSVAIGLNESGTFVISYASSPTSTGSPGQVQIDSSVNIALIPTDSVAITQGHLLVNGTGGYIVLPPSATSPTDAGFISFDGTGSDQTIHTYGTENAFFGDNCGHFGTITGSQNVGLGHNCMASATTASANVAIGAFAMDTVTSAGDNVAVGWAALSQITTGTNNVAVGESSLQFLHSDSDNVAIGSTALGRVRGGSRNVGIGTDAIFQINTGSRNVGIGYQVGLNYADVESDNILISNAGNTGDEALIRIGTSSTHVGCAIAGISGGTLLGGAYQPVMVSANGGLGTLTDATDGQVLIGSTAGSPEWATLTAGANITITNASNSITIAAAGSGTLTASATTTDATPTPLITVSVASGHMVTIKAVINGQKSTTDQAYGADVTFTVYRPTGGNVTLCGALIANANNTSTVDLSGTVNTGSQTAIINVIGNVAETWSWFGSYQTVVL